MDDPVRDSRPVRGVLLKYPQDDTGNLQEQTDTMKYIKQTDGISYDVYNFEMIIAIAFRICSKETLLFRRFVINEICTTKKGIPVTLFVSYGKNGNLWYSRGSSRQPPVPDARMQR